MFPVRTQSNASIYINKLNLHAAHSVVSDASMMYDSFTNWVINSAETMQEPKEYEESIRVMMQINDGSMVGCFFASGVF